MKVAQYILNQRQASRENSVHCIDAQIDYGEKRLAELQDVSASLAQNKRTVEMLISERAPAIQVFPGSVPAQHAAPLRSCVMRVVPSPDASKSRTSLSLERNSLPHQRDSGVRSRSVSADARRNSVLFGDQQKFAGDKTVMQYGQDLKRGKNL